MVFRYIRRMSNEQKEKIRRRLALAYAAIAWNGFAICLYAFVKKDKRISNLPIGLHEAALSESTEKVKVFTLKGISSIETITYEKEEIEEARRQLRSKLKSNGDERDDNDDDF